MKTVEHCAFLAVALIAAPLVSCTSARAPQPPASHVVSQQGVPLERHGRVTDHVIVISIDGLRPDAISKYNVPTIQRLMREGRYSLSAQTIALSLTLPSHTSMLTGVDADVHGVTWNSDKTREHGYVAVPTVFALARGSGFSTAAFFSKTKFHHLEDPATLDFSRSPKGGMDPIFGAERTVGYVREYFEKASPNLLFVHLIEPDFVGHQFGWMGRMYGNAVREADRGVQTLLREADERFGRGRYTVILTADHGGHKRTHGTNDPADMTIPWVVWGAGVQPGDSLSGIRTMDTAATVLWLLGVDAPANLTGKAITSAFESAVVGSR